MNSTVLSPWGEIEGKGAAALNPRLDTLNGKVIGLFAHFKGHSVLILEELKKLLLKKYPDATFREIQYKKHTLEIKNDPEFDEEFKNWLNDVDAVISAYGDAGSCCLFHAYNTSYVEKLGKPAVLIAKNDLYEVGKRGAASRLVPNLRIVAADMPDMSFIPELDQNILDNIIIPGVANCVEDITDALLRPLSEDEKTIIVKKNEFAGMTFNGDCREINDIFYRYGFTNGSPIIPPTEEAVNEMLQGTDLPRDYVVGNIPPMLGKATVERIAVNAVMCGCLPTYMPVLIACVQGMLDPKIRLEGWTCSVAAWAPMIFLNGPIRKDLNMNSEATVLSPYNKPSATIARAFSSIIMNIGGTRPNIEDACETGHESRLGICIAENEEDSPWAPMHTEFGYKKDDSAVTLFWSQNRINVYGHGKILRRLCNVDYEGYDMGCAYVLSPGLAKQIVGETGKSRKEVLDYIGEYARRPGSKVNNPWLIRNNHINNHVKLHTVLPEYPEDSTRIFWSTEHLMLCVGGSNYGVAGVMFPGGGEHGGPACIRINLPKNWESLKQKYSEHIPNYINY